MKYRTYIRLFLVILVASISLILFSYAHSNNAGAPKKEDCGGKCEQKKTQTEFILWESLSRNLLSLNHQ
jgi:hypothetical protein